MAGRYLRKVLFVVTGPSGTGDDPRKTKRSISHYFFLRQLVLRHMETDGVDYHFQKNNPNSTSNLETLNGQKFTYFYGTLKKPVEEALQKARVFY